MAIEKGLYAAPLGIDELAAMEEPDIEIEIEQIDLLSQFQSHSYEYSKLSR